MEYQSIISSNGSFRRVRIERRTRDRVDIELRIEPIDIEGTAEGPSGELDRSEADNINEDHELDAASENAADEEDDGSLRDAGQSASDDDDEEMEDDREGEETAGEEEDNEEDLDLNPPEHLAQQVRDHGMFTMDGHPRGPDGTRSPQFANSYHAYIKVNSLKYTIMQRASAKQLRYAKSIFKTGKLMKRIKNGLWAQLLLYAAAELRHEDLNRNQLSADELYAADVRFYEAGQREQIAIDHFDATAALLRQTMLTLMIEAREVLRKQMDQLQVLRELWLPLFGGDERGILELSMDPEVFRPNHDEANEAILSVQDHGEPQ